ncbi:MAG TPA: hypothetical protein ENI13_00075 [candidate division CPR3 bacterium]|uniref:Uncharacterized protein n=1 Tax=candidate division CPR3 bacterium TaxID=2268181 RepID=A0A7C1SQV9_UNCC3|nr:hypothetical protein [candidate division CPR3 bacterium]
MTELCKNCKVPGEYGTQTFCKDHLPLKEKQRTIQQNKALHVLYELYAEALNEAGLDMREVLDESVDIPWSKDTVKNYLWRPIQKTQLEKSSTTELTTKDIDKVFETLNRYLGEKHGLHVPFPSIEEVMFRQLEDKK